MKKSKKTNEKWRKPIENWRNPRKTIEKSQKHGKNHENMKEINEKWQKKMAKHDQQMTEFNEPQGNLNLLKPSSFCHFLKSFFCHF
jgi:hypothetical protein